MSANITAIIILLGTFTFLMVIKVGIAYAIAIATTITAIYLNFPLEVMLQNTVAGISSYSFLAVPFFVMMGEIMAVGGITDRILGLCRALVGWLPGGLALVNCIDSAFFGHMSGSSLADIASLGTTLIPMMEKEGYDKGFATSITIASSIEGILIPPSQNLVLYACIAGVSINAILMAGLLPGLVLTAALVVLCVVISIKEKYPRSKRYTLKETWHEIKNAFWGFSTIIVLLVGVSIGVMTATEAGAVAAAYALFVATVIYKELTWSKFLQILRNTIKTLSYVVFLVGAASAFGWIITFLGIPKIIATALLTISNNKWIVLLVVNAVLLVMGMFMSLGSIVVITTPILVPALASMGVDPVHFGVMMILNLGIGLCTPPVGASLYLGSAISGIPVLKLTKSMIPFYVAMFVALLLIIFIPDFSLLLPRLLVGYGA